MRNGLKLVHLATSYPVDIPLNYKEMQLALDKSDRMNDSWDVMCELVLDRTGTEIIDQMELVTMVVEGNEFPLH